MTLSIFYFAFWLIMRGSSFVRPSALQRGFVNIWLFALGWGFQVVAAVAEDRLQIGALYSFVFLQSAIFLSLLISLLELFGLPAKKDFASQYSALEDPDRADYHDEITRSGDDGERDASHDDEDHPAAEPTETTPLRAGEQGYGGNTHTSFADTYRRSVSENVTESPVPQSRPPYDHEQSWSGRLPTWTWFIQFLLLAPVPTILIGNLGLIAMSAMHMTGTDGGNLLTPLLALGIASIFLLLPVTPFIHRVTHHVPIFLLLVFIGTFIYNLVAFPFSTNHRFKFYFQQVIDLDHDTNIVTLSGIEDYTRSVIDSIPAAAGQDIDCHPTFGRDLVDCMYSASLLPPNPVDDKKLKDLISVAVLNTSDSSIATLRIDALDSRTCYLKTSRPVYGFSVEGGGKRDDRFGGLPPDGLHNIQIWRRDRSRPWRVSLELNDKESSKSLEDAQQLEMRTEAETSAMAVARQPLDVTVSCAYSDANEPTKIPAFYELKQYMPTWAVVTKKTVGLVEVRKTYRVPE